MGGGGVKDNIIKGFKLQSDSYSMQVKVIQYMSFISACVFIFLQKKVHIDI